MGRKEFWFKFDKLVENVRNSISLDDTVTFMLNVIIVFFVNLLLMCNLFSMRGILFQLETSSKISIMTVIVSSSISYLSLVYFRYKDNRKEYSKVKLDVYKDLLPMLYNNNEIIKACFVSYIERDSDNQMIKKHPIYKVWNDMQHDYRYLFIDSLLRGYMNRIFENYDQYFNYYHKAEMEINRDITLLLSKQGIKACVVKNCGSSLFDKVYRNKEVVLDDIGMMGNYNIDSKNSIINGVINIVKDNNNYNDMVKAYDLIKTLHKEVLSCIQRRILNYYW